MKQRIVGAAESQGEEPRQTPISVSWGRIGRRVLAVLLIVLGISILVWPLLHS
jgi:uncharacterized RDD family membrane protein YckC